MRLIPLVLVGFFLTFPAFAQDLPDAVATPYIAYSSAMEAEDFEAARTAARQAVRAAQRVELDAATTAILADNYAQLSEVLQDFSAAAAAYRQSAELHQQSGASVDVVAPMWLRASNAALIAGETNDAVRHADAAADMAENADALDAALQARLVFSGRALQAHGLWRNGRIRNADDRAREALSIADANETLTQSRLYPLMTFINGAVYAIDRDHLAAAYRLSQAFKLMPQQRDALGYWIGYIRGQMTESERERLLELIVEGDLLVDDASGGTLFDGEFALHDEPGFVDAEPLRRRPPDYPATVAAAGFEGIALIRFSVTEDGAVADPEVVLSIPFAEFGDSAERAVRRWRYQPATLNGQPIRRDGVVTQFHYALAN